MTDRHAYLVMCHTNFDQLNLLLDLLDDERNDIYLHIGKTATGYSIDEIRSHVKRAGLFFVKPMPVNWGGDTQIKLELKLLAEATKTPHSYYHLLSGMGLPLKSQDEIHAFFARNAGRDFVLLERRNPQNLTKSFMYKVNYFYWYQNHIKRNSDGLLMKLEKRSVALQKRLKVNRTRHTRINFQKGANWFSITHDAARFVLSEWKRYRKHFLFTACADEIFLQTILINSPLADRVVDDNLRYVDWFRGNPYTFRAEDFDLLMNSDKLFARKFDSKVDKEIIQMIHDALLNREPEGAKSIADE